MSDRPWRPGDPDRRASAPLAVVDHNALRDMLREELADALQNHPCRFDVEEAKVLHQAAGRLTLDQITALSLMARAVNGVGARVGQVMVWGALAAMAAGVVWLSKHGLLPEP